MIYKCIDIQPLQTLKNQNLQGMYFQRSQAQSLEKP